MNYSLNLLERALDMILKGAEIRLMGLKSWILFGFAFFGMRAMNVAFKPLGIFLFE